MISINTIASSIAFITFLAFLALLALQSSEIQMIATATILGLRSIRSKTRRGLIIGQSTTLLN
jgi:hypothetical protein